MRLEIGGLCLCGEASDLATWEQRSTHPVVACNVRRLNKQVKSGSKIEVDKTAVLPVKVGLGTRKAVIQWD